MGAIRATTGGARARRGRKRVRGLLPLALALAVVACRPELVVRVGTRVFFDGSLERTLLVLGRPADPDERAGPDWLTDTVGVTLADPGAWDRIEIGDDRIRASGFFPDADALPALLAYSAGDGSRSDRARTDLSIEERGVLRRWLYREMHGDPFGPPQAQEALDALVDLGVEALTSEVRALLGPETDTAGVERLVREDVRSLASALLLVERGSANRAGAGRRDELRQEVLRQHGVPVAEDLAEGDFWRVMPSTLLEWLRERTARALSTSETPVSPEDLTFWPSGDDPERALAAIARRTWGDDEEIEEEVLARLDELRGYFAGEDSPRLRFEIRVQLPGTLLATNGTPDGESVVWLFRAEDLSLGDRFLRIETVQPLRDRLTALGARREFNHLQLLQLADLLWRRDPEGVLTRLLDGAIERGSLRELRDEELVPDAYASVARELADLLDPDTPPYDAP